MVKKKTLDKEMEEIVAEHADLYEALANEDPNLIRLDGEDVKEYARRTIKENQSLFDRLSEL